MLPLYNKESTNYKPLNAHGNYLNPMNVDTWERFFTHLSNDKDAKRLGILLL